MATEFDTEDNRTAKRGPSTGLLLTGIFAVLVSIWALIGPAFFDGIDTSLGWVLVLAAVVVGAVLVFSPSKK